MLVRGDGAATYAGASYRPSARMKASPDTSLPHVGFRCVLTPSVTAKTTDTLKQNQTLIISSEKH